MEATEEKTIEEKGPAFQKEAIEKRPGLLLVLTGPTGAGKDAVMDELLKRYPEMTQVVSVTARERRVEDGEEHGKKYIYIDPDYVEENPERLRENNRRFLEMKEKGRFLEDNFYGGAYYGTLKESIDPVLAGQDMVWRVDASRAAKVEELFREKFPKKTAEELIKRTVVVYIRAPSLTVQKDRFYSRELRKMKERLSAEDLSEEERKRLRDEIESERKELRKEFRKRLRGMEGEKRSKSDPILEGDWKDWIEYGDKFENVIINKEGKLDQTVEEVSNLIEEHQRSVAKLSEVQLK